jgi:isopentenyldiphosphate isomerase
MNDEKIIVSPLDDLNKRQPYSRRRYYDEQFSGAGQPLAAHIIDVMLFDISGDLIVQKRSQTKNHNPGMIDKTLGGHIVYGDNPDYTVMVESVQELLTPSIALDSETDFDKALALLKAYIDTVALVLKKSTELFQFEKVHNGQRYLVPNAVHLYYGVYGGKMRPADREASGILYYSLDQLEKEIQTTPDLFTDDLKQIVTKQRSELAEFSDKLRRVIAE